MTIPWIQLTAAIIGSVLFSLMGNRWIDQYYEKEASILSFPETIGKRSRPRHKLLAPILAFLFTFTILRHSDILPLHLYFLLTFEYALVLYTFTDFEQQVIFDAMLLPFALIGAVYTSAMGLPVFDHALAAVVGGGAFLLISVATHGGIGGGDIKLIASLGLWLGSDGLLAIVVIGLILGGISALLLLVTGKKKKGEYFAYGPYFTIVAILAVIY